MEWEYKIGVATYHAFPYWDAKKDGKGGWRMRQDHESIYDEFIKAEERDKIGLWAQRKWRELGLDPDVDWRGIGAGRIMRDPWRECLRLEEDALNAFGQRGWELVTAYPRKIPHGGDMGHWSAQTIEFLLKRPGLATGDASSIPPDDHSS